jgi:hypothetical protein
MRKVLIGCGVAGGLCILAVVVGAILIRSWISKQFPDAKDIENVHVQLEQKFGKVDAFVPPLDGVPAADRIERFVVLRETLAPKRAAAAGRLSSFIRQTSQGRDRERPWVTKAVEAIGTVRGGGEMAIAMSDYFGSRGRLLLEADMGEGEYRYLYGLAYFGWLGWQPLADSSAVAELRKLDSDLVDEVEGARARIGRVLLTQFENQARALDAKPSRSAAEEATLATLRAELPVALQSGSFPFAGKVPAQWAAPLVPYRERLLATLPEEPLEIGLDVMRFESRGRKNVTIK